MLKKVNIFRYVGKNIIEILFWKMNEKLSMKPTYIILCKYIFENQRIIIKLNIFDKMLINENEIMLCYVIENFKLLYLKK